MTVPENVMTFMMCLVVQGDAAVPVLVSLTSQPGTAVPGDGEIYLYSFRTLVLHFKD